MAQCITKMKYMIDWLKLQFTWKHIGEIIVKGLAVFGGIQAFFEFSDYFFKNLAIGGDINKLKDCFSNHILLFAIILIVVLFILVQRKSNFSWKVNGTNLTVEIALCDFFKQEGLKVIHVTDTFDTDYTIPNLIDPKTLHGQFLNMFYSKRKEIDRQIIEELKSCKQDKNAKLPAKKCIYSIGTVAMINMADNHYALTVYSRMQPDKRAIMPQSKEEYNDFLVNMWVNLAKKATTDETVNVVVFGEGLNRMPASFTKQKKISEIIRSFIVCSLEGVSYKKLRICLKCNKRENLEEFEKLQYLQYEFDSMNVQTGGKPVGNVINPT